MCPPSWVSRGTTVCSAPTKAHTQNAPLQTFFQSHIPSNLRKITPFRQPKGVWTFAILAMQ